MKTLDEQIAAVKRELCLRKSFYAKSVFSSRMKQATADHEIACMEAVLETLLKVQANDPR